MKVVILAGGLGSRISEYTKYIPKPMIRIKGTPLLVHIMKHYSKFGFMKGNLHKMTIGGYLYEQVGIIKSLTYDIPEETSWEIGIDNKEGAGDDTSVKELPHIIKVTGFTFTPIHTFVPRKQTNSYAGVDETTITFGPERFIALAAGTSRNKTDNNYDLEGNNYTKLMPQ